MKSPQLLVVQHYCRTSRFIGGTLDWYSPGEPTGFIASVIGAIVLLLIYGMVRKKK